MITELQKQARRLRAQIAEAFDAVPYPRDNNICDGSKLDDDYDDVIRNLTGKHWRELIPGRKPPKGRSNPLSKDMTFCSEAAWHFFLPAYLLTDLMMGEINTFPFEMRSHNGPRFDRLSVEQCSVLVSFFKYAGVVLDRKQEKLPLHSSYFKARRRELVAVTAYWNSRIKQL